MRSLPVWITPETQIKAACKELPLEIIMWINVVCFAFPGLIVSAHVSQELGTEWEPRARYQRAGALWPDCSTKSPSSCSCPAKMSLSLQAVVDCVCFHLEVTFSWIYTYQQYNQISHVDLNGCEKEVFSNTYRSVPTSHKSLKWVRPIKGPRVR